MNYYFALVQSLFLQPRTSSPTTNARQRVRDSPGAAEIQLHLKEAIAWVESATCATTLSRTAMNTLFLLSRALRLHFPCMFSLVCKSSSGSTLGLRAPP